MLVAWWKVRLKLFGSASAARPTPHRTLKHPSSFSAWYCASYPLHLGARKCEFNTDFPGLCNFYRGFNVRLSSYCAVFTERPVFGIMAEQKPKWSQLRGEWSHQRRWPQQRYEWWGKRTWTESQRYWLSSAEDDWASDCARMYRVQAGKSQGMVIRCHKHTDDRRCLCQTSLCCTV